MKVRTPARILVGGAGIAGLSAALALQHMGCRVTVLERHPPDHPAGSGVVLWPNGTRILARLGLLPRLTTLGTVLTGVRVHRLDGGVIGRTDLAGFSQACEAPVIAIDRNVLKSALLSALPEKDIHFDAEIARVDQLDEAVSVRTSDGRLHHGDGLLLAGGLHCALRDRYVAAASIRPAGVTDWLGVADLPRHEADEHEACEFIGPGLRAGFIPLPDGRTYFRFTAADLPHRGSAEPMTRLRTLFAGRCAALDRHLLMLDGAHVHVVREADMAPLSRWCSHRVCVIGDAAHGMTPALGQGANQAIVDAWTVAMTLTRAEGGHDLPGRWRQFQEARKAAAEKVVAASRAKTALFSAAGDAIMAHWYDDMERLDSPQALAELHALCRPACPEPPSRLLRSETRSEMRTHG